MLWGRPRNDANINYIKKTEAKLTTVVISISVVKWKELPHLLTNNIYFALNYQVNNVFLCLFCENRTIAPKCIPTCAKSSHNRNTACTGDNYCGHAFAGGYVDGMRVE